MAQKEQITSEKVGSVVLYVILAAVLIFLYVFTIEESNRKIRVPATELASMDFTVHNITETRLSANWDLSIRIPGDLPGYYICLQGDVQASLLYKNVTLAISTPQKYNDLKYYNPQILKLSANVTEEDICGLIGKDIINDVKERKEVKFGLQFSLTDCRKKSTGVMSYACNEATLRFEPDSESEMKATVFGKHPTCTSF
ncbi:PREDICTED: uncharacterized protein LOC104704785 [Camelina sativa]|uniref:Uncharacterized protein LOC104704785 n=1 Tax=Camelina sativa TaxID=90675 RepID=A0ABM0T0V5_CAMSA|nr:PREDICTED: uncharacterized protein LOC104704785 [Camelina sativa]